MLDAWQDLILGSSCCACARPGRALCRACEAGLPTRAAAAWPSPTPAGLVRPSSCGEYADPLRAMVVDHKERGRLALARPLGRLLGHAVADSWDAAGRGPLEGGRFWLVPVPSHPRAVRTRGHDPLLRVARCAAAALRCQGAAATVLPALRVVSRPGDQAGLTAGERARNVAGRFALRGPVQLTRPVVLVDDVVTTGATLREAQRALEDAGADVVGAATVAATRRRHRPGAAVGPERGATA